MKKIIPILALLFAFSINAQLPDGSVAPDFTVTDINGNTHNLHDILDSGKNVLLKFYATWCGACWGHHQSGLFEDLYDELGPSGSDELVIIYMESASNTPESSITDNGGNTYGDWTVGNNFIHANNNTIAQQYQIPHYPTYYAICSADKTLRSYNTNSNGYPSTVASWENELDECPALYAGNNNMTVNGISGGGNGGYCGEFTPSVTFKNVGLSPVNSFDASLFVNGSFEQSTSWSSGILPTGEEVMIDFDPLDLDGDSDLQVQITAVNGGVDDVAANDIFTEVVSAAMDLSGTDITLEVMTDNFGFENGWEITDDMGAVVASGGNPDVIPGANLWNGTNPNIPGSYPINSLQVEEISLPGPGCYQFRIMDDYGDGMCCDYGIGFYRFLDVDGTIIYENASFGGAETTNVFSVLTQSAPSVFGTVFFEGFHDDNGHLTTALNANDVFPMNQPFNDDIFNYQGNEMITNPALNMVDWVLVQLRSTIDDKLIVDQRAALVSYNGNLLDMDGSEGVAFENAPLDDYYLVIFHKGHLPIISSSMYTLGSGVDYDFTAGLDQVKGNEQMKIEGDYSVMIAGDADQNGIINTADFNRWATNNSAVYEYLSHDFNGNGVINVQDYNLWFKNRSKVGHASIQQ